MDRIAAQPWFAPVLWPFALAILGAILGSFIAALAIRWPDGRSVVRGRSACDACGATLRAIDLVPLISAVALRGRCRDCAGPIDPLHARVELAAAVVGGLAGVAAAGPVAIGGAVFGWLLLALALLDLRVFWLPDRLTVTLALAGLVTAGVGWWPPIQDRLIGGAAGLASLWAIGALYRALRGRDGLGGGDPKLFGAIGLWLGWRMLPAVLVLASLTGLAVIVAARLAGRDVRWDSRVPFGALLAFAAYLAWLFMVAGTP